MLLWKSQTRVICIPSASSMEDNTAYIPYKVGGKANGSAAHWKSLMEIQISIIF